MSDLLTVPPLETFTLFLTNRLSFSGTFFMLLQLQTNAASNSTGEIRLATRKKTENSTGIRIKRERLVKEKKGSNVKR